MIVKSEHGKLYMERVPGFGWALTSIFVEPEYRGQGIGGVLMHKALAKCGRPVYLFATSELGGDIKRLKKFYKRFGFVPFRQNKQDMFPYRFNMILIR